MVADDSGGFRWTFKRVSRSLRFGFVLSLTEWLNTRLLDAGLQPVGL